MNTKEIREQAIRFRLDDWHKDMLFEALDEIDRLNDKPLLSDGEFNEVQMKLEVEHRTKEAIWGRVKRLVPFPYDAIKRTINSAEINE